MAANLQKSMCEHVTRLPLMPYNVCVKREILTWQSIEYDRNEDKGTNKSSDSDPGNKTPKELPENLLVCERNKEWR